MECIKNQFRVSLDIEPVNIVKNEPLSNFFIRFNPIYGALVIQLMGFLLIGGITYLENTLFKGNSAKTAVPLMKDVNDIALIVVYLPGLFFVSLLYYRAIKVLQADLFSFRIIGNREFDSVNEISKITDADIRNHKEYLSFLHNFRVWYCSRWVTFGCIAIAAIVTYWCLYKPFINLDTWLTIRAPDNWVYSMHSIKIPPQPKIFSWGGRFYAIFIFALYIYLFVNLFYRGIITTSLWYHVFKKFTVNIEFLHPDQCGGLKMIGHLVNTFNWAVFIGGLNVASLIYTQKEIMGVPFTHYVNIVPLAAYILLAPVIFFGMLYTTHREMKKNKILLHRGISISYDIILKNNQVNILAGNVDLNNIAKLDGLQKTYEMTKQFPEWPINIRMISYLCGTVLIPIIMSFLTDIINKIKGLL